MSKTEDFAKDFLQRFVESGISPGETADVILAMWGILLGLQTELTDEQAVKLIQTDPTVKVCFLAGFQIGRDQRQRFDWGSR